MKYFPDGGCITAAVLLAQLRGMLLADMLRIQDFAQAELPEGQDRMEVDSSPEGSKERAGRLG